MLRLHRAELLAQLGQFAGLRLAQLGQLGLALAGGLGLGFLGLGGGFLGLAELRGQPRDVRCQARGLRAGALRALDRLGMLRLHRAELLAQAGKLALALLFGRHARGR